jgi:protein TonB
MNASSSTPWVKYSPLSNFTFLPIISHHSARFVLFLFLALLLHAFVIFKIGFSLPEKVKQQPKTLDIIINPIKTDHKVKKADYFAQNNQQGGGLQESKEKAANVIATSPEKPRIAVKKPPPIKKIVKQQVIKKVLKSEFSTEKKSIIKAKKLQVKKKKTNKKITKKISKKLPISSNYLANLKQQIVDLEADIDTKTRVYSRRSKHKYVNASTAKALDALYIRQWTRKIERIGNLNYPTQARKDQLSGKLILAVTIDAKGNLINIKIRKSSKHKILDDAAINIVKLSAPYAPIPKNVLQGNTALVITRTWLFTQKGSGAFLMK